jgi:mRNA interferase RelE/StbE
MFRIEFSTSAKREIEKLEIYKEKLLNVLRILSIDPLPTKYYDVKKLRGIENTFRIRIGKVRIVYIVDWKSKVVIIARIGFRGRVY